MLIKDGIDQLKKHIYIKWVQAEEFNKIKSELEEVKLLFSVTIVRVTKTLNKLKFKVHILEIHVLVVVPHVTIRKLMKILSGILSQ